MRAKTVEKRGEKQVIELRESFPRRNCIRFCPVRSRLPSRDA
jgi:hypothetical protein